MPAPKKPTPETMAEAAAALRRGELVVFPTETVYGVGADAGRAEAVRRIFEAKGRPADHPLIVHIADPSELPGWAAEVPEAAWALAERFWPGPLTLVLPRAPGVPLEVTGGQDTVALRVPGHPLALELLRSFAGGVAAPSANRFGHISPTRATDAAAELGDSVAVVLDGGPCDVGLESTIVDLSGSRPRLLRPGRIGRDELVGVLGTLGSPAADEGPRAPGRLARHYAPEVPTRLVEPTALEELARSTAASVVARREAPPGHQGSWRRLPDDPEGYGRALYRTLRELESLGRPILIETPSAEGEWEAVRDRLRRAAAGRHEEEP